MNQDDTRTDLEHLVLLRSSGEISAPDAERLTEAIANDAELAAFAHAVDATHALGARAPRDFAAEAIAEVSSTPAPADFASRAIQSSAARRFAWQKPAAWALAAAAAITLLFVLLPAEHSSSATTRTTVAISQQLDTIEQELTPSANGRYRSRRHS